MKRIEDRLRDLWDNIKCTNIQIIWVPEEEEKKKGSEKIFEEIIVENFPNKGKEIVNQVQEVQRVPYRINPSRHMARYLLLKVSKIKYKEKILKAAVGASLVAQCLRVCLPMQGTWVRAPIWEDPTCHGVAGPVSHGR